MKLHFVAKRGNADLTEACVRVQVCPNPFQLCQREEKEKELEDKGDCFTNMTLFLNRW